MTALYLVCTYVPRYAYHALNVDLAAWKSDRPRKLRNVWPLWRALTRDRARIKEMQYCTILMRSRITQALQSHAESDYAKHHHFSPLHSGKCFTFYDDFRLQSVEITFLWYERCTFDGKMVAKGAIGIQFSSGLHFLNFGAFFIARIVSQSHYLFWFHKIITKLGSH